MIRSIAIVGDLDYGEVYEEIHYRSREGIGMGTKKRLELIASLAMQGDTPDNGVYAEIYKGYLADYGWEWTPTVFIGSGCQVHLKAGELPMGRLLVRASKHLTAVLYGVIHDTFDPSRRGTRCVYGYWEPSASWPWRLIPPTASAGEKKI